MDSWSHVIKGKIDISQSAGLVVSQLDWDEHVAKADSTGKLRICLHREFVTWKLQFFITAFLSSKMYLIQYETRKNIENNQVCDRGHLKWRLAVFCS